MCKTKIISLIILISISYLNAQLRWGGSIVAPDHDDSTKVFSDKTFEFMSSDNTIVCIQFSYKRGKQTGNKPMFIELKSPEVYFKDYEGPKAEKFDLQLVIPGSPYNAIAAISYEVGVQRRLSGNTIYYDCLGFGLIPDYKNAQQNEKVEFKINSIDGSVFFLNYRKTKSGKVLSSDLLTRNNVKKKIEDISISSSIQTDDRLEEALNPRMTVKAVNIDSTKFKPDWGRSGGNIFDIKEEEEHALEQEY